MGIEAVYEIEAARALIADLVAERDELRAACRAVLEWAQTPGSIEQGTISYFAEVVVPKVDAAIRGQS